MAPDKPIKIITAESLTIREYFSDVLKYRSLSGTKEALTCVLMEFFDCVNQGRQPLANGLNAISVIRILEKAQTSLFSGGEKISVN
jgi:hypothetical protein